MKRHARRTLAMALALSMYATTAGQESPAGPRRYALLVGVTSFTAPAMQKFNLEGPANDVALFRSVLERTFRVPSSAIVSLAGHPADAAARPTRANIERELRRLRDTVSPGDHVVVLLAGHGSQQPADHDPADPEPDGLDEIFLPSDAMGWDGEKGHVANAVVDDDVKEWVGAIRNKGASVWLVADACHSGTLTRATTTRARARGIPADALIPAAALRAARRRAPAATGGAFELSPDAADIAALYAANMVETTPELPMPDRSGPVHGLFTYTLAQVLSQHTEAMTYRELLQRVIDRYRAEGFYPTPAFEGAGLDREVLGERAAADRPRFTLGAQTDAGWPLDAGSIHGLTAGSILEVFPPVESTDANRAVGHVRVASVRPAHAIVQPVPFAGTPAPAAERLVPGSRARTKYHEFGDLRLRVAAERASPRAVDDALNTLSARTGGLAERVVAPAPADWFVRIDRNRVSLVPARDPSTPPLTVGAVTDPALPDLLADKVRRIARVANLTRLSAYRDGQAALQVTLLRWRPGAKNGLPLLASDTEPRIAIGDSLQIVVKNTGAVPLDVTLLYVTAHYGIIPLFPRADSALDNRIDPGMERALEPIKVQDPVGWESVVALGVLSMLRYENFRGLAQESLERARPSAGGAPSPARRLLEEALYGDASARRARDEDLGRFAISVASVHVVQASPRHR